MTGTEQAGMLLQRCDGAGGVGENERGGKKERRVYGNSLERRGRLFEEQRIVCMCVCFST